MGRGNNRQGHRTTHSVDLPLAPQQSKADNTALLSPPLRPQEPVTGRTWQPVDLKKELDCGCLWTGHHRKKKKKSQKVSVWVDVSSHVNAMSALSANQRSVVCCLSLVPSSFDSKNNKDNPDQPTTPFLQTFQSPSLSLTSHARGEMSIPPYPLPNIP